ncbi:14471_t:CDS:2 [Dentiscutata erythropus]|uniref:14471_t:CDS:1 n=1 Tax=Dentiscutata erythropus TaxID=1348616 RepID=A0A9N8VEK7_9GLOM|nr:14471_t:CDS:2 [Dentiscutata erythropus]
MTRLFNSMISQIGHHMNKCYTANGVGLFRSCFHSSAVTQVKQLGVVGAGQMGIGIALVGAKVAQLPVKILDTNLKQIEKGLKLVDVLISKDVSKNRITDEEGVFIKKRITTVTDISELSDVDFIIEAVSENIDLKRKFFEDLDNVLNKESILATNTSSISITKIAAATKRPEKIISGLTTSDETLNITKKLAISMGKTCTQSQDVPGFIANRLLMPYINEAIIVLEQGIATREDVDTTMKLGTNTPMGPLTLADFIGLDTCLAIMKVLHNELGEKYRPAILLQKYVDAGLLDSIKVIWAEFPEVIQEIKLIHLIL